jgi:NADH-quinone oxidoreductase subunit M
MGYVTIGIFSFNEQGISGAIFQMISHGLVSAALFLMIGFLYHQTHTKEIEKYGGVANQIPVFAAFSLFFIMASIGLPGTSGFVGEFLVLLGVFQIDKLYSLICGSGLILGAVYSLWLYKRVYFSQIVNPDVYSLKDIDLKEFIYFGVLLLMVLVLGLYPMLIFSSTEESVSKLVEHFLFYRNL